MWQSSQMGIIIRKLVLLVLLGICLMLAWYGIVWLTKGTIVITVPEGASVAIHKSGLDDDRVGSSNQPGEQRFRLSRGAYNVVLTRDFSASKTSVSLGIREEERVSLELSEPSNVYQVNSANASVVGSAGNMPVYLDGATGRIIDANGQPLTSRFFKGRLGVFADDGSSQLLVDATGFGFLVRSGNKVIEVGEDHEKPQDSLSMDQFGAIATAAYDPVTTNYCVLSSKGALGWISSQTGTLSKAGQLDTELQPDTIDCHDGLMVYGRINIDPDAETRSRNLSTELYAYDDGKSKELAKGRITAFQLGQNSLAYVEQGLVKQRALDNPDSRVIFNTTNTNPTALLVGGNDLYVFDEQEVWRLNQDRSSASRVVASPSLQAVAGRAVLPGGKLMFSVTRGIDLGIYITSSDPAVKAAWEKLQLKLPYNGATFGITQHFNGSKLIIKVENYAPIPSSGSLEQRNQARREAEAYIAGLTLDPSVTEVIYE